MICIKKENFDYKLISENEKRLVVLSSINLFNYYFTEQYINIKADIKKCLKKKLDGRTRFAKRLNNNMQYMGTEKGMYVYSNGVISGSSDLIHNAKEDAINTDQLIKVMQEWEKYSMEIIPKDIEDLQYLHVVMLGI